VLTWVDKPESIVSKVEVKLEKQLEVIKYAEKPKEHEL
jgi:hypothetical protein